VGRYRAVLIAAAAASAAFLAVFFLWPLVAIVWRGIAPDGVPAPDAILDALGRPRTLRIIGLTLGQAAIGSLASVLLGLAPAYALYRLRFRGRGVLRALAIVPFVLPTVVVGVAFKVLLAGTALDGSWWAIVLALVFFNVPVVIRTVGGAWEDLDPQLEDAAADLGARPAAVFLRVTLPRLLPSIAAAAIIVFLYCTTAFGVVLVLGGTRYGTVETEIWQRTTQYLDLPGASALSIVQGVFVVLVLLAAAAVRVRPELRAPATARGPRRGDLAVLLVAAGVGVLLAVPVVALAARSFRAGEDWSWTNWTGLVDPSRFAGLGTSPLAALGHSLGFALGGTAIAMLLGLAVSVLLSRRPAGIAGRRLRGLAEGAFMLPLGVSAVTLGFGFLVALDRPPLDLRSSPLLIPIAQGLVAAPLVIRTLLPALRGTDPLLRDAAADLGASPLRALAVVELGMARRALAAAGGLAFAVCLGEFGATSFLSRPELTTLPVLVGRLAGRPGPGGIGAADAVAVVLALVVAAALLLGELRLRRPATEPTSGSRSPAASRMPGGTSTPPSSLVPRG